MSKLWYNITYKGKGEDKMIVVKNAYFNTDNKKVECKLEFYDYHNSYLPKPS